MRKGSTLLLLAMALCVCACPWLPGNWHANAATLEPTDSGAPSAIMIFPVGEKPNPAGAAMAPVAFNHVIHEKWMARAGKDCMVCHHTGDPDSCTSCHTVQGSKKGNYITLYDAMHKPEIAPRKEYTPSSCVSCHEAQLKERNCAGCHATLVRNARESDKWCAVCHTASPAMTPKQLKAGIAGTLSEEKNEALAADTVLARRQQNYWSDMAGPYKVSIDSLQGKYEPCLFNHRHHVRSMLDRIRPSLLAGAFHTEPATVCVTCHHNSPPSANPPRCISCHSKQIDRENPAVPRLMAAFHLECMSCHTDMKVARPQNSACATCHRERPVAAAATGQGE